MEQNSFNLKALIESRTQALEKVFQLKDKLEELALLVRECIERGGKVITFGNGGSAAQAAHLTSELVWKFKSPERRRIPAVNLSGEVATITAVSNDSSFEDVFCVQVEALASEKDLIIAFSTSGRSKNVIKALHAARKKGVKTVLFTGSNPPETPAEIVISAPSSDTPLVQEMHLFLIHALCEILEKKGFKK